MAKDALDNYHLAIQYLIQEEIVMDILDMMVFVKIVKNHIVNLKLAIMLQTHLILMHYASNIR